MDILKILERHVVKVGMFNIICISSIDVKMGEYIVKESNTSVVCIFDTCVTKKYKIDAFNNSMREMLLSFLVDFNKHLVLPKIVIYSDDEFCYTISERSSVNSSKFLSLLSSEEIIKFVKVLCLTLQELYDKYGFIHGDLHSGNIIVVGNKKDYYIRFIDFDLSRFSYNTKIISSDVIEELYEKKIQPCTDILKFLISQYIFTKKGIYKELMMQIFNETSDDMCDFVYKYNSKMSYIDMANKIE